MTTTAQFVALIPRLKAVTTDVAVKPKYDSKTGKLSGPTLQEQFDSGKIPPALAGMIILARTRDTATGHIIGWHWMDEATFRARFTTANSTLGKFKNDPYVIAWKQAKLI